MENSTMPDPFRPLGLKPKLLTVRLGTYASLCVEYLSVRDKTTGVMAS